MASRVGWRQSRRREILFPQDKTMASKLQISLFAGLLFYIIANPVTYSVVNGLLSRVGIPVAISGKPTGTGLLLHSAVYAAVTYLLMNV